MRFFTWTTLTVLTCAGCGGSSGPTGAGGTGTTTGTTAVYCPDVGAVSIRATDSDRVIVDAQLLSFTPGG